MFSLSEQTAMEQLTYRDENAGIPEYPQKKTDRPKRGLESITSSQTLLLP